MQFQKFVRSLLKVILRYTAAVQKDRETSRFGKEKKICITNADLLYNTNSQAVFFPLPFNKPQLSEASF